ncbi:MAG TPA: tetratricopeptide repeat protein [Chitinophagales bacterium]|nr:tetratricopeptide repeat protein [Chitinophagales bacterium]
MADELENVSDSLENGFGKVQQFVDNNQQKVLIGGGVVLAIVIALVYVFGFYIPGQNLKAQKAIYMADFAFAKDSFELALNGRTTGVTPFKGYAQVAKDFSMTKTGKLASYCAGVCCLHLKKFDEATKYLDACSPNDPIIGALRLSDLGDAYTELGKFDEGVKYYEKAANYSDNEAYTPYFLFKTGLAYEHQKKNAEAKKFYEKVRDNYPKSDEGRDIEKYIARVSAQ